MASHSFDPPHLLPQRQKGKRTMKTKQTTLLSLPLLMALCLPAAHAEESIKEACKQDAKTLCQGIQPGGGRIAACLKQHKDEVSAECKDAVKEQRGEHRRRPGRKASDAS